jgi:hypothetical protein
MFRWPEACIWIIEVLLERLALHGVRWVSVGDSRGCGGGRRRCRRLSGSVSTGFAGVSDWGRRWLCDVIDVGRVVNVLEGQGVQMRLKSLILALFAVFAFSTFSASAVAAEGPWEDFRSTLKYEGSSSFSMTSTTTDLLDTTHVNTFICKESSVSGTAEPSGTTNAGSLIHFTSWTWNKGSETCEASFGLKFAVTESASATKPWLFHALYRLIADPHHHFLGLILNIHAVLKGTECELEVNGHIPALVLLLLKAGVQPEMDFDFNSAVNTNSINLSSSLTITILKESGLLKCGTAKSGDKFLLDGVYEETAGPTKVTLE